MHDENNICFYMNEKQKPNEKMEHSDDKWIEDMKQNIYQLEGDDIQSDVEISKEFLLEIEFNDSTLKELHVFCDYYKLARSRKKKNELIKMLIEFELNPKHIDIVETRRTMWDYMMSLKEDSFFKKFILYER